MATGGDYLTKSKGPTYCDLCKEFIFGLVHQGYYYFLSKWWLNHKLKGKRCKGCKYAVHHKCAEKVEEERNEDFIQNYHRALFCFNLLLANYNDAIREGDGERVMNCLSMSLLYFRCYGHTKYAYSVAKMFYRIRYQPYVAFDLIWNRFVNTKGIRRRIISMDFL